jgi:hypothetical protein
VLLEVAPGASVSIDVALLNLQLGALVSQVVEESLGFGAARAALPRKEHEHRGCLERGAGALRCLRRCCGQD